MNYDEINVGDEIPSLTIEASIVRSVMYCAITWDFARLHYDPEFTQGFEFPKPVLDPQIYGAYMARMLTDWLSVSGRIKKLSLRYRAPCFVGDRLTYKGKVSEKYERDGEKYIDFHLTIEKEKGEHPVEGSASIVFF